MRGSDEFVSPVTSLLVRRAVDRAECDGHLDPARAVAAEVSAAGWIGRAVGATRSTGSLLLRAASVNGVSLWLIVISMVPEATANSLLVLALAVRHGAVVTGRCGAQAAGLSEDPQTVADAAGPGTSGQATLASALLGARQRIIVCPPAMPSNGTTEIQRCHVPGHLDDARSR